MAIDLQKELTIKLSLKEACSLWAASILSLRYIDDPASIDKITKSCVHLKEQIEKFRKENHEN